MIRLLFALILLLLSYPAYADSASFGLAMHGATKYDENSPHLDYANPNSPQAGHLKIAAIGTFNNLNPYSIKGQAPENMNLVYDRLMRRVWDEPFTMYPLIAERFEAPEDRSSITFHLNPKATFHDGSPITAKDVEFSFNTLKDFGRPNMRNIYKLVKNVTVPSERSIKFEFGEGYDRETVMIIAMMPVLSKTWWSGRSFDETLTETPLLNGPYRIKENETGRYITYERVDDYWAKDLFVNRGHNNFDTITYEYYRDDTIALESFKKGDLNLRREWDVTKWRTAYTDVSSNIVLYDSPHKRPERAHGFIFNMRRPLFQDRNVRRALSLAFDHEWVQKNLFHGEFQRIESFFPNSVLDGSGQISDSAQSKMDEWKDTLSAAVFQDTLKTESDAPFRSRLREASNLLKNAGWIIEDGKLIHRDTKDHFLFELILSTPQEQKVALAYQKSLERLGIQMTIRMLDSATFQERKTSYDYDMISFYWQNSLSPGTEQSLYWSCKAADEPARFNFSGICHPALDHFSAQIPNSQTYQELQDYAQIIDRILLSEYISIPLFYKGVDYIAYQKDIKHSQTVPMYGAVLESWWIDTSNSDKITQ